MTHWIQADDLSLGIASRLENVKIWDFEGTGSFQGLLVWQIYSNVWQISSQGASNAPGVLLLTGTSTNVTHQPTGFVLSGYAEYVTTFDIAPVSLPPGVYWFALHNGPLSWNDNTGRTYWEATNTLPASPSQSLIAPFTAPPWWRHTIPAPVDLAFQINGVPGPRITALGFVSNAPRISFTTTSGQVYRVEYKNILTDPAWSTVSGADAVSGSGGIVTVSDPDPSARSSGRRYYRARLCPCQTIQGPTIAGFDYDAAPRISFTTVAGQLYRVEYKADLKSALWTPLPGAEIIGGTGQTVQITDNDPNIASVSHRFYRAVVVQ
jgi:hypothetical protein